jgi:hypothetical protein
MTPRARDAGTGKGGARVKRVIARTAATLAAATLGIGVLHMPFARGLLMRAGGCPMAGAKMTPAQMDRARRMSVATTETGEVAPARPALGFTLDATTLADVHSWAKRNHIDCDDVRDGLVTCANVPPGALARPDVEKPVDELSLAFDVHGHLVNVTTLRSHLGPDDAARSARDITAALEGSLGVARKVAGDFAPPRLARPGPASLATRAYRFRDYVADVTAMNVPSAGLAVREHYMSASVRE